MYNVIAGPYPLMCRVIKCKFCTWDIDKFGDHLFGSHRSQGPLQHSPAELHAQYLDSESHIRQLELVELNRVWKQQRTTLKCRFKQCFRLSVPTRNEMKSHTFVVTLAAKQLYSAQSLDSIPQYEITGPSNTNDDPLIFALIGRPVARPFAPSKVASIIVRHQTGSGRPFVLSTFNHCNRNAVS